jgi:hypothetical protein
MAVYWCWHSHSHRQRCYHHLHGTQTFSTPWNLTSDIEKDPFGYYGPGALRARKTTRIGESVVRLFQTVLMDASSYTTLSHSPASRCAHCSLLSLTCSRIHPCGQPMPYAMSTLTQRSCAWKARRSVQLKMGKIASGGVFAWDTTDMMAGDCRSAKDGAHADSSYLLLLL